jgi:DNA polymerase-1
VLSQLAEDYPLPKLLLEHRSLAKLKNTYTDKLPQMVNPRTGRVHTSFSQAVAVTGRLASSEPNLQNIPIRTPEGRRIRAAFIAPAGHKIVSADYSQIELRIMAHLSGDAGLTAPSPAARTCTAPPPARSSASPRSRSPASSAATPR